MSYSALSDSFEYGHYKYVYSYSAGSTESDVYRRQILSTKVDPRAVRVNPFPVNLSY